MTTYVVVLHAADARVQHMTVEARTEQAACLIAKREADRREPGAGWQPAYAL